MIQCPKCHATLPDWQTRCQFCQADTTKVARPTATVVIPKTALGVPQWVWPVYCAIAIYWIVEGGIWVFRWLMEMGILSRYGVHFNIFTFIWLIWGGIHILAGTGLLLRWEFIRGCVNILCWLKIGLTLLCMPFTIIGGLMMGPMAVVMLLMEGFGVFTAAMMIYLIGETDKQAWT